VDTIKSIEEFLRDENWTGGNPIPTEYMTLSSWEPLVQEAKLIYGESACMVFSRTLLGQPELGNAVPGGDPWAFLSCCSRNLAGETCYQAYSKEQIFIRRS
jgi:hypothetical protein